MTGEYLPFGASADPRGNQSLGDPRTSELIMLWDISGHLERSPQMPQNRPEARDPRGMAFRGASQKRFHARSRNLS